MLEVSTSTLAQLISAIPKTKNFKENHLTKVKDQEDSETSDWV